MSWNLKNFSCAFSSSFSFWLCQIPPLNLMSPRKMRYFWKKSSNTAIDNLNHVHISKDVITQPTRLCNTGPVLYRTGTRHLSKNFQLKNARFSYWYSNIGANHKWRHQLFSTFWPLHATFIHLRHQFLPLPNWKWWRHLWEAPYTKQTRSTTTNYTSSELDDS